MQAEYSSQGCLRAGLATIVIKARAQAFSGFAYDSR